MGIHQNLSPYSVPVFVIKIAGRSTAADSAVHTAVALALLARHFIDRQDEWRMLADKAQRWLEKKALKLPDDAASWAMWAAQVCGIE